MVRRRIFPERVDAGLEDHQSPRHLALELVGYTDHRALGHVRVAGKRGLHRAGRQPVSRNVEDVVGAAHDVQVAVLVEVASVAGEVVPLER
jgi:hypothetical protein